jgi:16S rRNA (guanine(966)-N(2))-methyltransferase RsmD
LKPAGKPAGQIRIIGGQLRRSVLPVADVPGLRPSPDRVRETLFNWLGQSLAPVSVLDAFAGSGVLGFEALSRGAARVDFHETHPQALQQLRLCADVLLQRLGRPATVQVSGQDVCLALHRLQQNAGFRYDLVLLDPPFASDWLSKVLPLAVACLSDEGVVYVEWHCHLEDDAALVALVNDLGLDLHRAQRAGQVHYHLLRRKPLATA